MASERIIESESPMDFITRHEKLRKGMNELAEVERHNIKDATKELIRKKLGESKEQDKKRLEDELRALEGSTEKKEHEAIIRKYVREIVEKYPEKYPETHFEENMASIFESEVFPTRVARDMREHYHGFLKERLQEIDKKVSENDIDKHGRLAVIGTVAKLAREDRIKFFGEGWEKRLPILYSYALGRASARRTRRRQEMIFNLLKKLIKDEGSEERERRGVGSNPDAMKHITFQTLVGSYLEKDEQKRTEREERFRSALRMDIQESLFKLVDVFRDEIMKTQFSQYGTGTKLDKETKKDIDREVRRDLPLYAIGAIFELVQPWSQNRKGIDIDEIEMEKLIYDLFFERKSIVQRFFDLM